MQTNQKLSSLQLELLKIYSFNPNKGQLKEIKEILGRYFAKKFTDKIDKAVNKKGLIQEDIENWLNE